MSRKSFCFASGIALCAISVTFGSTYAASVSLNAGNDIEFGQGSQQAVTCDSSIIVRTNATYQPASDAWLLDFGVGNIGATTCSGKRITVTAWNDNMQPAETWSLTLDKVSDAGPNFGGSRGQANWRYFTMNGDYFVVVGASLDSRQLKTITVESSN